MMRIAHVLHGWPPETMGGTGMYVLALAEAQAAMGHPTAIVSPHAGEATKQVHSSSTAEQWRIHTSSVRRWSDTWNGTLTGWLQWCGDWLPDVVHIHHLSGWPLGLIEATTCHTVLTLHDYAIPCARGQLVTEDLVPCMGPEATRCSRCLAPALRTHPALVALGNVLRPFPKVASLGRKAVGRQTHLPDPRIRARLAAAKAALEAADVLLAPSVDLSKRMGRLGYRTANHTELPLLRPAERLLPVPQGPVRFLFASTIIPTKGPDRVIDAFLGMDTTATLTIAGAAPDFPSHPNFAKRLQARVAGHPKIQWLGCVAPNAIPKLMAQHDVLLLPSLWPENSPLVVREATAAGLQIIASTQGGVQELAPDVHGIETNADLIQAMNQVARDGRMRHPPSAWPTPEQHAKTLLQAAYKATRA